MLPLSIYVLYSNVTYIYPVSCLVEIKLFKKKIDVIMNANKVTSVNFEILLVSRLEKVLISHQNPPPHK